MGKMTYKSTRQHTRSNLYSCKHSWLFRSQSKNPSSLTSRSDNGDVSRLHEFWHGNHTVIAQCIHGNTYSRMCQLLRRQLSSFHMISHCFTACFMLVFNDLDGVQMHVADLQFQSSKEMWKAVHFWISVQSMLLLETLCITLLLRKG